MVELSYRGNGKSDQLNYDPLERKPCCEKERAIPIGFANHGRLGDPER
jgi:hypothetical protein